MSGGSGANVPGSKPQIVPPGSQVSIAQPWAPNQPAWGGADMWRPGVTGTMPMPRSMPQGYTGGGTWRQATQPFGMLIPSLLPGMMQQRQMQTPAAAPTPGTPVSGSTGQFGTPQQIAATQPAAPQPTNGPPPGVPDYIWQLALNTPGN